MGIGTNVFFQINLEKNYSNSKNNIYIYIKSLKNFSQNQFENKLHSRNWTTVFGLQK